MSGRRHCPRCGEPIVQGARFCTQCGRDLVTSQLDCSTLLYLVDIVGPQSERVLLTEEDTAAIAALPAGCAFLICCRGAGAGSRYLLDRDRLTMGRHSDNDIWLPGITVSRHHLELLRTTDGYRMRDLGSLNGTYVNQDRIDEATLQDSDEIRVGKFRLVYVENPAAPRSTW